MLVVFNCQTLRRPEARGGHWKPSLPNARRPSGRRAPGAYESASTAGSGTGSVGVRTGFPRDDKRDLSRAIANGRCRPSGTRRDGAARSAAADSARLPRLLELASSGQALGSRRSGGTASAAPEKGRRDNVSSVRGRRDAATASGHRSRANPPLGPARSAGERFPGPTVGETRESLFKTTLRQGWPLVLAQGRNVRSKCRCSCVLQFTRRRAVCCVFHRPTSRVIHRSG